MIVDEMLEGERGGSEERLERRGLQQREAFETWECGGCDGTCGSRVGEVAVVDGEEAETRAAGDGGDTVSGEARAEAQGEALKGGVEVGEESTQLGAAEGEAVVEAELAELAVVRGEAEVLEEERTGQADAEEDGKDAVRALLTGEQAVEQRVEGGAEVRAERRGEGVAGVAKQLGGGVLVVGQCADGGREGRPGGPAAAHRLLQNQRLQGVRAAAGSSGGDGAGGGGDGRWLRV
mmetsp:Transcript_12874/g.32854  ORF Transcript_12874/g.32854 Transcript_12874/m.32854 type:complete len:235 (+) Transcript_12874:596-1300(+)